MKRAEIDKILNELLEMDPEFYNYYLISLS